MSVCSIIRDAKYNLLAEVLRTSSPPCDAVPMIPRSTNSCFTLSFENLPISVLSFCISD